jgi:hypothetical protein
MYCIVSVAQSVDTRIHKHKDRQFPIQISSQSIITVVPHLPMQEQMKTYKVYKVTYIYINLFHVFHS